jgi:hypothetical protein
MDATQGLAGTQASDGIHRFNVERFEEHRVPDEDLPLAVEDDHGDIRGVEECTD